ncbi:MAG: IclR family transcriptional regulator [Nocardioides sp.]|uniref:IclR family transcriptional regulator n=1 Tax=Nocardioides sp. TaxID=35761 RepID=UPI0039E56277
MPSSTPERDAKSDGSGVRSVARAVEILALLREDRPMVTVAEAVKETGLAKTTVVRMLHTLEANGLVWSTPRGITAGPGLWRWAYLAQTAWQIPGEIRQLMRELSDQTKETVNLYARRDVMRVCIAQQQSTQTLRHVVRVGDELPLWAGASSRVLMSDASSNLIARVAGLSPHGAALLPQLTSSVDRAREDGYAVTHGEREVGVSAIAVPVFSPSGRVGSALTISGPTARFTDERLEEFRTRLGEVAAQMTSRSFSHPFED